MELGKITAQHKYIVFLSMLYITIMICNTILTNKFIKIGSEFVLGGAFLSPLLFILGDIIAEIYGYKLARLIVWFGFICQTIFAILSKVFINLPSPAFWHEQHSYSYVLGPLLYIDLSSFIAFFTSSLINIHILTKWKKLTQGKFFWLRSLGSSTFAEALYSAISIMLIKLSSMPFSTVLRIILLTYIIKVIYSLIFAYPGNLIVNHIKYATKTDIYD